MEFWVRYTDFIAHGTAKHHHHICVSFHCKWLRWMPAHTENCALGNKPQAFPHRSAGKESTCNEGDLGSIPGLGQSTREGKGYPLQYSGLESSMDCIVHGVAKSQTWLSNFHFTLAILNLWWVGIMLVLSSGAACYTNILEKIFWKEGGLLLCL